LHLGLSQFSFAALQLLFSVIVTRALTASGRGQMALVVVTATLGSCLFEFGGEWAAISESSSGRALSHLFLDRRLLLRSSLGCVGVFVVLAFLSLRSDLGLGLIAVGSGGTYLMMAQRDLTGWLAGAHQTSVVIVIRILSPLGSLVMVLALHLVGSQPRLTSFQAALAYFVGIAVSIAAGIGLSHIRRTVADAPTEHVGKVQRMPLHLGQVGIYATYRMDQLLLGAVGTTTQLGFYAIAVNISEVTQYIPAALTAVIAGDRSTTKGQRWRRLAAGAVFAFTMALALGLYVIRRPLIRRLYGERYLPASRPLGILLIASVAFSIVRLLWGEVLRLRRYGGFAAVCLSVALFSIPVYLFLIDRYSGVGAAEGSLIAYTALAIGLAAVQVGSHDSRTRARRADMAAVEAATRL